MTNFGISSGASDRFRRRIALTAKLFKEQYDKVVHHSLVKKVSCPFFQVKEAEGEDALDTE